MTALSLHQTIASGTKECAEQAISHVNVVQTTRSSLPGLREVDFRTLFRPALSLVNSLEWMKMSGRKGTVN